ncbi:MAG: tyrosine-protein phosphatase [Halioglobus sp.]
MFYPLACHVERDQNQDYRIRWATAYPGQSISIFMADSPDAFYAGAKPDAPVCESTSEEAVVPNPDKTTRHYFYLESRHSEGIILAERRLPLEGTPNLRDLGGYETVDGRRLKWGKLYRSSKLSALTESDRAYFHRLGVILICDLRQAVEQQMEPTLLDPDVKYMLAHLPVTPGSSQSFLDNLHRGVMDVQDTAGFMEGINRDFVASQLPQYAQMFKLLLGSTPPFLIHCASGKDRTGFGAALILDVLGVPEEVIIEDYLLTNKYLPIEQEIERLAGELKDQTGAGVSKELLRPMLEVRPEYIMACFEEIAKRYESREHFHASALALDARNISVLKERFLT